ncbi:Molecular chaperone (DnaJ superfamily) [Plasmopara halstedii]|uniref:Molecular chaperone (DnaJ superfamily) n=1 Tax=Plasmopara halstedii TaxID=4781 RepID=A0A0P1AEC7_PLAHL|nr:Molecular chaperone (DnaJ superfamily) [Plasmopara halstedii]CEG39186.1 Molecular chaperone (DnaJ superfamily) [Plasmopara halstedii]|eukprot:XP_024575555.1 Molecular chaperone (DnaJ superfamily) [Plasmopara halstedii]
MAQVTSIQSKGLSPHELTKRRALLAKIEDFEARGAILTSDARTLRSQLHDSTSGQWKAVEVRLQQLARNWNPYQDDNCATTNSSGTKKRKVAKPLDFYQLLELQHDANVTTEDIKRQFRKLALQLHPDKRRTSRKRDRKSINDDQEDEVKKEVVDTTQFARLRLAYETLCDPLRRTAYDAKLQEIYHLQDSGEVVTKQVKLEASTDFASLEWMARVKHKMDVMARITEWAKLLSLDANELRFETGEPCMGKECGKIVSMDRDLECSGSLRRRVYICLLHKYIHACDENCTSTFGDAELDRRVCRMRAYWLIQNWLFDQLQASALQSQSLNDISIEKASGNEKLKRESCEDSACRPTLHASAICGLEPSNIHLGDQYTRFQINKIAECQSDVCRSNFQFLEEGIYACRHHGTPHVCTFDQCDRQELHVGSYICWVSGIVYGREREQVGTDVRTRRIIYSDEQGEDSTVEMEVPVMLPLGKTTKYLLEGDLSSRNLGNMSSLSPPPPDEKAWKKHFRCNLNGFDILADNSRSPQRESGKRFKRDREQELEKSPVRKRLNQRLISKIQQSETTSFHIFLKLPSAVATLPKVALELEETTGSYLDDDNDATDNKNLLQIFVNSNHTVNYIKYWMEELTEQQLSIWDQQIYWSDTLIGEETNVMVLEEHGISVGCVLELRLHDDCPLLLSTWNGKSAATGGCIEAPVEYNTVQISKEAAEELDDLYKEWENVGAVEEQAFEEIRLKRQRFKLRRAIEHTEVLRYDDAKSEARLLGVIQKQALSVSDDGKFNRQLLPQSAHLRGKSDFKRDSAIIESEVLVKEEREQVSRGVEAMRSVSNDAQPLIGVKSKRGSTSQNTCVRHTHLSIKGRGKDSSTALKQ